MDIMMAKFLKQKKVKLLTIILAEDQINPQQKIPLSQNYYQIVQKISI